MFLTHARESCSVPPVAEDAGQGGTTSVFIPIETGFQNGLGVIISVWFSLSVGEGI